MAAPTPPRISTSLTDTTGVQGCGDLRAELLSLAQGVRRPPSRPGQENEGFGARERAAAAAGSRSILGGSGAGGRRLGKLVAPERRRQAVDGIREKYGLSERHACRIVGQHRGTQRYVPTVLADEDELTRAIIALASEYGRYGYRRVTALLQAAGWQVGRDRVQRIWRREGLKVPQKHRRAAGFGSMTARACDYGRSTATTSGASTSCKRGPTTDARSGS